MIKTVLRNILPQSTRVAIRRVGRRIRHFGSGRYCPVCRCWQKDFRSHGNPPTLDVSCWVCYSKDSHRLAGLLFDEYRKYLFQKGTTCIHIAPEEGLARQLKTLCQQAQMTYRYGGLISEGNQDRNREHFDLLDCSLENDSVQLLYCCHVINALIEDKRAISEVYRVMSDQGIAILQVPAFCPDTATREAIGEDDAERLAMFNDPDIYRCYTDIDYRKRLREAGFIVHSLESRFYPDQKRTLMGLHGDVVHLGFKDENHPLAKILEVKR